MKHYVFGEFRSGDLEDADIHAILGQARGLVAGVRRIPHDDILHLLDRLSRRWADPADRYRKQALDGLPDQIGFSRPMVEKDLEGFVMALSRPFSEAKVKAELGGPAVLDGWIGSGPYLRAQSKGVVLHVAAGNVGSVGVLSLVEGLLAKNVNILKAASSAPLFPELFAQSLIETDEEGLIARSFAILTWSGRKSKHHKIAQQKADAIVVWGGEDVVKEYREGLGLQCSLVEWGPKVSVGMVAREVDLAEAARAAAADVSMWDQNACSSAQVLYVEGAERIPEFVTHLENALEEFETRLPMGPRDLQDKAEITKTRQLALMDVAMGQAEMRLPNGQEWTIIVDFDPAFKPSPLFRTVYVKAVADLGECAAHLAPYRAYLQTIGLAAPPARALSIADAMFEAGALRMTPLGAMSGGTPGEPHDGLLALHALIRWVSADVPIADRFYDPIDFLDAERLEDLHRDKLRAVYRRVRDLSPFYRRHLPETYADWGCLPLLSKDQIKERVPPFGADFLCGDPGDALTLRSGGSSGTPTVALVSRADFEADMKAGARGAHAAGLRAGDSVANLFFAGNLYGSFISTNRILEILGCRNYALTSHAPLKDILEALRIFRIETVIGLPSHLQLVFAAIAEDPARYAVRRVFYAGEHFYAKEQAFLEETLGITRIASIGYGTVDAGPIAYQCAATTGSVHHVLAGHQHVEIVDRVSLQPAAPGEIGEIIVTNLSPRLMPLVRYRIGDLGRLVAGRCACGIESPRFELLGRADDVAVVGGYNLAYVAFQAIVERYASVGSTPQLELLQEGHRDRLLIKVERVFEASAEPVGLHEALIAAIPELKKALDTGMLGALEVRVLPPGGLERLDRTGKIVHVIDRRRRTGQLA